MGVSEGVVGFSYASFRWAGTRLLKVFPSLPEKLEVSGIRIHPEAYASLTAMITLLSLLICASLGVFIYLMTQNIFLLIIFLTLPLLIFLIVLTYPYGQASARAATLESEVPYAACYLAVMSTGGISPYTSLTRVAKGDIMPQISKTARIAEMNVKVIGMDPVSAIENMVKGVPSKEYRDIMTGYASTLRIGGDVVHFLIRKTEQIFLSRMGKMRIVGERMGMIMEGYAALTMMLSIVVFTIFIVSRALPSEFLTMPQEGFIMIAYVVIPFLSMFFLYLADIMQPKYPKTDKRPYIAFALTIPFAIAFFVLFVIPSILEALQTIPPFNITYEAIVRFRELMNLEPGYEFPISLALFFMILFGPAMVVHEKYSKESFSLLHGITLFLRDLTEIRKTGLSPEKCIMELANKHYEAFSKHLKVIARQIGWGMPLRKIYRDFTQKVHTWTANVTMYILIDAIDVGGGTADTLETLASFAEDLEEIERQKRAALKPLMIIPYLTAVLLIIVVIILVVFMRNLLEIATIYISQREFIHLFLPPVVLIAAISGLVAGKISSGVTSAGFKHAFILSLTALLSFWIAGTYIPELLELPPLQT